MAAHLFDVGAESVWLSTLAVLGSLGLPLAVAYDAERIGDETDWGP